MRPSEKPSNISGYSYGTNNSWWQTFDFNRENLRITEEFYFLTGKNGHRHKKQYIARIPRSTQSLKHKIKYLLILSNKTTNINLRVLGAFPLYFSVITSQGITNIIVIICYCLLVMGKIQIRLSSRIRVIGFRKFKSDIYCKTTFRILKFRNSGFIRFSDNPDLCHIITIYIVQFFVTVRIDENVLYNRNIKYLL